MKLLILLALTSMLLIAAYQLNSALKVVTEQQQRLQSLQGETYEQ